LPQKAKGCHSIGDKESMTGEQRQGSVVEVKVGKCVFVAVVITADEAGVCLEMDGGLKAGAIVSVYDPVSDSTTQGKVLDCTPINSGGFLLHIESSPASVTEGDAAFIWQHSALHTAHLYLCR
jgi:hypothetical protein